MQRFWEYVDRVANVYQLWPLIGPVALAISAIGAMMIGYLVQLPWYVVILIGIILLPLSVAVSAKTQSWIILRARTAGDLLILNIDRANFTLYFEEGQIDRPVWEIEVTFNPNGPMQLARIQLSDGVEVIEPMVHQLDLPSLPCLLERPETRVIRFQVPRKFIDFTLGRIYNVRVIALAGGRTWESNWVGRNLPISTKEKSGM